MTAPIALFAFKRPGHLNRTIKALAANHGASSHDVVAFVDGPRHAAEAIDQQGVLHLLEDWRDRGAFRSLTIDAQPANIGLRRSIVRGVTRLCDQAGEVIVVEDDLETSPWFLEYCRQGLEVYRDDPRVASIHGYVYPVDAELPATFFLRGADCWGWATWKRAWAGYRDDAVGLQTEIRARRLGLAFDHGGRRDLQDMLARAAEGRVDSWAIRWHASAFLAGQHTLYPGKSLVSNIGLDGTGTHCGVDDEGQTVLNDHAVSVVRQVVEEHSLAHAAIGRYFKREPMWKRLIKKLKVIGK